MISVIARALQSTEKHVNVNHTLLAQTLVSALRSAPTWRPVEVSPPASFHWIEPSKSVGFFRDNRDSRVRPRQAPKIGRLCYLLFYCKR